MGYIIYFNRMEGVEGMEGMEGRITGLIFRIPKNLWRSTPSTLYITLHSMLSLNFLKTPVFLPWAVPFGWAITPTPSLP